MLFQKSKVVNLGSRKERRLRFCRACYRILLRFVIHEQLELQSEGRKTDLRKSSVAKFCLFEVRYVYDLPNT